MHNLLVLAGAYASMRNHKRSGKGGKPGRSVRVRTRKSMFRIHEKLGEGLFRRAFRIRFETFLRLYSCIRKELFEELKYNCWCDRGPNGRVHPSIILGIAIRMFAGADSLDLITSFGVSKTIVHDSVNHVINAVCMSKSLKIAFPREHQEQLRIAKEFEVRSDAKFRSCAGAIDGMLIWISKPCEKKCKKIGLGSGKFYCGRKKKIGLNLKATVTITRNFIALSIKYPGSSSDFMAFENSDLRRELESSNFLYSGLCLFGDNAYVNTKYMATPYPNVKQGNKDAYNFYHSQLRICVECAFGMLVF